MSEYQNVVGGRLKLKGKPLDVKEGGVKKKKKHRREESSQVEHGQQYEGTSLSYLPCGTRRPHPAPQARNGPGQAWRHTTTPPPCAASLHQILQLRRLYIVAASSTSPIGS